jgi:FkbM family methyltransferase
MMLNIINTLDRKGYKGLLLSVIRVAYLLKGFGYVSVKYHKGFRAYEFKVKGITYLSPGPGWAYSYQFLLNTLKNTFCHFYLPRPGDCIIDIGAGLGEETVIFSQLTGGTGKVFCIEANPHTYAGLEYLCRQNKFDWAKPMNVAIYNDDTTVVIEDDVENYLGNTINKAASAKKTFQIQAKTLDTLVGENNIKRIDFLKSNIEGAEQFMIQGMTHASGIIKNLCISCHDFRHRCNQDGEFYVTKGKVITFLKNAGFQVATRETGNPVVDDYVYASRIIER